MTTQNVRGDSLDALVSRRARRYGAERTANPAVGVVLRALRKPRTLRGFAMLIWGRLRSTAALGVLSKWHRKGLVESNGRRYFLTPEGRERLLVEDSATTRMNAPASSEARPPFTTSEQRVDRGGPCDGGDGYAAYLHCRSNETDYDLLPAV